MPRNGTGGYSLPNNSWNPAVNGAAATAADWQSLIDDVATGLQQSVSSDGQTPMTGNLDMGGFVLTGLGAPSGTGQSLRWEQLVKGADIASAAALPIPVEGSYFNVTGTTTITSIPDVYPGRLVYLKFTGVLTLTNSASLVLPNLADYTTMAGDILVFLNDSPGVWVCVAYPNRTLALGTFRNKIINAQGLLNQRGYVSGTATTGANQYTIDRWKVVTSGQALTIAGSGISNILTAPAGGIEQVVEATFMEGGTYSLSWIGTATATVNGTPVTNGGTITLSANANATVRFTNGTVRLPQLERGWVTPFEYLPAEITEVRALRYFESSQGNMSFTQPGNSGSVPQRLPVMYRISKRASPSVAVTVGIGSVSFVSGNPVFAVFGFGGAAQQENQWSWTASSEL